MPMRARKTITAERNAKQRRTRPRELLAGRPKIELKLQWFKGFAEFDGEDEEFGEEFS